MPYIVGDCSNFTQYTVPGCILAGFYQVVKLVSTYQLSMRYSIQGERERNVGKVMFGMAVGYVLQPLLSSALLALGDFKLLWLFFTVFMPVYGVLMYFLLSKARDAYFTVLEEESAVESQKINLDIVKLCCYRNFGFSFFAIMLYHAANTLQSAILINGLMETYDMTIEKVNIQIFMYALACCVGAPLAQPIITNQLSRRRTLIQTSLVLYSVSLVFRTGLDKCYPAVNVTSITIGIFYGLLETTCTAEAVASVEETRLYENYNTDKIHLDLSSWLTIGRCVFIGLTNLFSNVVAEWIGVMNTTIAAGLALLAYTFFYTIVCGLGPHFQTKGSPLS